MACGVAWAAYLLSVEEKLIEFDDGDGDDLKLKLLGTFKFDWLLDELVFSPSNEELELLFDLLVELLLDCRTKSTDIR